MDARHKLKNVINCPVCKCSHVPNNKDITNGVYAATCENCGHFFKFRATSDLASEISLTINGEKYTVGSEYDASTSLNSFLRKSRISMGTKVMCREGGCGTCVVTAKLFDPVSNTNKSYAINSCLCPVFMCDGWEITTIEGLADTGPNSIPKRLTDYNGSQCGFCSPAQVMNMYSLLDYNSGAVTMKQVEDAYDGIICRCTGYRPIMDAMKSFALDSAQNKNPGKVIDIEELGKKKLCKKNGRPCTGSCTPGSNKARQILVGDSVWYKPTTITELFNILSQNRGKKIRLTFGNTGTGVYKQIGQWMFDKLVDLRGIRELYVTNYGTTIVIGAGISLSQLKDISFRGKLTSHFGGTFTELYNMLSIIANTPVRNMGCWAGNLMLKHQFPDFASDLFVTLEAVGAKLQISDANGPNEYSLTDFMKLDMTEKLILCMLLPPFDDTYYIRCYKIMKRHQNSHAYVNAGIRMCLDKNNRFMVKKPPCIVFGGISSTFVHAVNTEMYLNGKQLADPAVLKGALTVLASEVIPDSSPILSSAACRKKMVLSLLYRFFLDVLGDTINSRYKSGGKPLERPLSSGQQSYDTKKLEWPVTEPVMKIESLYQTSGKATYINDIPPTPRELYAAFVTSTVANAKIQNIDPTDALNIPGVVKFISAKDIPGKNNIAPDGYATEEVLCSGDVLNNGQAIGIIVAEDQMLANSAARRVKVTYTDVKQPILNIEEAIKQQSFYPTPKHLKDVIVGDAEGAIGSSPRKISGTISTGDQYHFHMETQIAICVPREDGMDIDASTQWIDLNQLAVAQVLGCKESSILVRVKRLGGSFGAKITRNAPVACACALAAHILNRPIRMEFDLERNMEMMGGRFPCQANYEVGFTNEGMLNGVKITYYTDCGSNDNESPLIGTLESGSNAYHCANWHLIPVNVKTNKPLNTSLRAPGHCVGIFVMESIMEHVAKSLGKDPTEIRKMNLIQKGQVTPMKTPLTYCNISTIFSSLEQSASFVQRQQEISAYNKANRWKKRGLSIVPMRYSLVWNYHYTMYELNVFGGDGSVSITHGGIESGQGVNTKVVQVASYELGIPFDMIKVQPTDGFSCANTNSTGGSVTSELACKGIIECCNQIKQAMAPVKAKMKEPNPTWQQIIAACAQQGVNLNARYWDTSDIDNHDYFPIRYMSYGATCAEVELDVLTGQHQINRVDILIDCGESINPAIDVGQIEGAFVMGLGAWLFEEILHDPTDGKRLVHNTWEYKPPLTKDIPIDFRIQLLKNAPNPVGVLRSKAIGEPPQCMSCSALFALKHAIEEARKEINQDTYFPLNAPATVDALHTACLIDVSQFTI